MSTDFRPLKDILAHEMFDGRLETFGVSERFVADQSTERSRCLTDGRNFMWVYSNDHGFVSGITRYGGNAPSKILRAISETFDTDIVSEHEPQYWGFDTQEEWDAFEDKLAKESKEAFYNNLLKYLRGEPNDIKPGTIGMLKAQIAEKLVSDDPELLMPTNEGKLYELMNSIYDRDYTIKIQLSEEEMAAAKLMVTHEDDLPSA
jgi:hypothetical protein